ncbi:beta-1,3-glucan-binding protein-like [Mizuhopecten yessoensis]|uniref:beta-1,3-glucan-binding protein-like n=1 Tax=Mizuhopecten yessoensis TaxID=6573 RepID=UPI000B458279|nr:beta-1,3-glucan-binding protein-like [Mizuhopecten yessoensis]
MERHLLLMVLITSAKAFRDDFNTWNASSYSIEVSAWGGGNNEFQAYTNDPSNIYVKGGNLYLRPTFTVDNPHFDEAKLYNGEMDLRSLWQTCTFSGFDGCHKTANGHGEILPPVLSGKITTNFAFTYGRVNVRAKIPKGDWIWPAIWLIPSDSHYGGWPRSGDIDIIESRGNTKAVINGVNQGVNQLVSKLNWGPDYRHNAADKTTEYARKSVGDWHGWHTYSMEWTPDHIITLVDNVEILRVNTPTTGFWNFGGFQGQDIWTAGGRNAPFDQPYRLILSVAVGGDFFEDGDYDTPRPWGHSSHPKRDFWEHRADWGDTWRGEDAAMIVDYIEMIPTSRTAANSKRE